MSESVASPLAKHSVCFYKIIDKVLRLTLRVLRPSAFTEKVALWWGYKFRPAPRIVKLRSGALIQLSQIDHLQLLLYYTGTFEPYSLAVASRLTKKGGTFLDIGANIGLYSLEASLAVGSTGKVIAIEAAPTHAKSVAESARLNGMTNIKTINVAVGDSYGEARLTLPRDTNFGMFTLGEVNGDDSFMVPLRRIDDLLTEDNVTRVDFIKMDIEGSEYQALLGARKTIETHHPVILIELNESALNKCGSSARQVKELLARFGYSGSVIQGHSLKPILKDQSHICDECLFVRH